jgi:polysaccharide export outer membrane protein
MRWISAATAALLALACGACAGQVQSPLPSGAAAYEAIPVQVMDQRLSQRIRAGDRLAIRVFGEPELTSDAYRVDSTGFLQVPLVGQIIAAGVTPEELRSELARRLGARYIREPQVTVAVVERARANFAVEGEVEEPGVFEVDEGTTLLSALARAKSPTQTAKLDEVLVFRTIDGKRLGARFDLRQIRAGLAPDPQIIGGDTIVVGYSATKGAFRDFLEAVPLFNLFYLLR